MTGPTGTFGFGLMPLLQRDDRIERIAGIARRPFEPAEHGWTKMEYRRGDVRKPESLAEAVAPASSTTTAQTFSPQCSSGSPMTATSTTAGCW